jgi:hypothetical protein
MDGRLRSEQVAGFNRNPRPTSSEYAGGLRDKRLGRVQAEEEGTASTFQGFTEVFVAHGLPSSVYTDRGSHYFHTPVAGGPVDKLNKTQVGRALSHLGIEHIPAYSPEARGRSERMFPPCRTG